MSETVTHNVTLSLVCAICRTQWMPGITRMSPEYRDGEIYATVHAPTRCPVCDATDAVIEEFRRVQKARRRDAEMPF